MKKLHESLIKNEDKSGVCHHMIFDTFYINELFKLVETNNTGSFYDIFLRNVIDYNSSGASEYEIYFNYMLKYNKDKIKIRGLNWANVNSINQNLNKNYDYISFHSYLRKSI